MESESKIEFCETAVTLSTKKKKKEIRVTTKKRTYIRTKGTKEKKKKNLERRGVYDHKRTWGQETTILLSQHC